MFFHDKGLNNRDRLEELIKLLLRLCRKHNVPITQGVSFGFAVTRVSASSALAESCDPFLRFSMGEESEAEMSLLCATVVQAIERFLGASPDGPFDLRS